MGLGVLSEFFQKFLMTLLIHMRRFSTGVCCIVRTVLNFQAIAIDVTCKPFKGHPFINCSLTDCREPRRWDTELALEKVGQSWSILNA